MVANTFYSWINNCYFVINGSNSFSSTNFYLPASMKILNKIKKVSEKILVYITFPILYFVFLGISKILYKAYSFFKKEKEENKKISKELKDYEEPF